MSKIHFSHVANIAQSPKGSLVIRKPPHCARKKNIQIPFSLPWPYSPDFLYWISAPNRPLMLQRGTFFLADTANGNQVVCGQKTRRSSPSLCLLFPSLDDITSSSSPPSPFLPGLFVRLWSDLALVKLFPPNCPISFLSIERSLFHQWQTGATQLEEMNGPEIEWPKGGKNGKENAEIFIAKVASPSPLPWLKIIPIFVQLHASLAKARWNMEHYNYRKREARRTSSALTKTNAQSSTLIDTFPLFLFAIPFPAPWSLFLPISLAPSRPSHCPECVRLMYLRRRPVFQVPSSLGKRENRTRRRNPFRVPSFLKELAQQISGPRMEKQKDRRNARARARS